MPSRHGDNFRAAMLTFVSGIRSACPDRTRVQERTRTCRGDNLLQLHAAATKTCRPSEHDALITPCCSICASHAQVVAIAYLACSCFQTATATRLPVSQPAYSHQHLPSNSANHCRPPLIFFHLPVSAIQPAGDALLVTWVHLRTDRWCRPQAASGLLRPQVCCLPQHPHCSSMTNAPPRFSQPALLSMFMPSNDDPMIWLSHS